MPHNMTVTIDDRLWREMKRHNDVRWSAVMRDAVKKRVDALETLERFSANSTLSEEEMTTIAIGLGKQITGRK